jgi:hypothetical protein
MLKREVPYFNAKKSVKLAELPPAGEKIPAIGAVQ